jgi:pimeloyl-ACP methyl ester carboxylesterase
MLDSVQVIGDYEPPRIATTPVLVLLHGLGSTRGEWTPLVKAATDRGWGALAYDARGHGDSQQRVISSGNDSGRVDYRDVRYRQDPGFWKKMVQDLVQVTAALQSQKGVAGTRVIFVGASLGANVALLAAEQLNGIPGAVMLSPGLNYAGLETLPAIRRWKRPLLLVAARPDTYAFRSVQDLSRAAFKPALVRTLLLEDPGPAGGHGVQLFDGDVEQNILDWIAGLKSFQAR